MITNEFALQRTTVITSLRGITRWNNSLQDLSVPSKTLRANASHIYAHTHSTYAYTCNKSVRIHTSLQMSWNEFVCLCEMGQKVARLGNRVLLVYNDTRSSAPEFGTCWKTLLRRAARLHCCGVQPDCVAAAFSLYHYAVAAFSQIALLRRPARQR